MSDKSELETARDEMLSVLDGKLHLMAEWRAFRAILRALAVKPDRAETRSRSGRPSYADLGIEALDQAGSPLRTNELLEYVAVKRGLSPEALKKARITIQSSFSKDKRLESIPWNGSRAWWIANRSIPNGAAIEAAPS